MFNKFRRMMNKINTGNALGVSPALLQKLQQPPTFTPDGAELESRQHNLVFLYGNEMTNGRGKLPVRPLYTDVYTTDPFIMVKTKIGEKTVPAVLDRPYDVIGGIVGGLPKAPVKGELYQLTAEELETLDHDYLNGLLYRRQRIRVKIEHYAISKHLAGTYRQSEALFAEKRVWMYIGDYERWSFMKLSRNSFNLLKERDNNPSHEPRYYFAPTDWE